VSDCTHENRTVDCVCNDCGYDLIVDTLAEKYAALERERIIKLLDMVHFEGAIRPVGTVYWIDDKGNTIIPSWALRGSMTRTELIALIKGENK
jgi:hypothetical protein